MFRSYKDMMGRMVEIKSPPGRIVSVVPSQTELLYDLGLEDEVVGITKFCVHPDSWFRNKTRVGGTKQLHLDKIGELQPDLIIANKEENTREQIEALAAEFPVWISDIKTVDQGVEMIVMIGEITSRETEAANIINEIRSGFENLRINPVGKKVAYFIWYRPWMAAGGDTFISDMLARTGWTNVFASAERYPEISAEQMAGAQPELVLLSSEPFPFKEKHIAEIQEIVPRAQVMLVDGEMFSWYGSRMRLAPGYIQNILRKLA